MYDSEHNNHEDKSEIIRRFNEGETIKAIANSMGRTLNSVGNIIAYARKKNPELVPYKSAAMNSGASTGYTALDAAIETLRKEMRVLELQQIRTKEKLAGLRRTIASIQRVVR